MKYFLLDIIPSIKRFSQNLDELTLIQNYHWILLEEDPTIKTTLIFRDNNELVISKNGIVEIGKWDYLGNQSYLFETKEATLLLNGSFHDEEFLIFNLNDTELYAILFNSDKLGTQYNSIEKFNDYLKSKYTSEIEQIKEINSLDYEEGPSTHEFDLLLGSYIAYPIIFSNGKKGKIMKGKTSGEYFYLHHTLGRTYAKSKIDCIYQLFLLLENRI